MKVELRRATIDPEEICGEAAAICTHSGNVERALAHAVASGHTSVLEHASFTFRIEGVSRVTLAQLTRHRLASPSVESQRYVNCKNKEYIIPETIEKAYGAETRDLVNQLFVLYEAMTKAGIPAEDARYILPQGVTTGLIITMNARELLHFFELRCCNRAQWEIRALADEMLAICKQVAPKIFEKAGPGCVCNGHCTEIRPCGHPRVEL